MKRVLLLLVLLCLATAGWWRLRVANLRAMSLTATRPQNADLVAAEEKRATGLRPPTPAEHVAMDQQLIATGEVRPNQLGLDRINAERVRQGLPKAEVIPAPVGREVVPKR